MTRHAYFPGLSDQESNLERLERAAISGKLDRRSFIKAAAAAGASALALPALAEAQPFDLVMLEIGAFHPAWGDIHLGPENAMKAHGLLGGGVLLPVHWGTFSLAMHAWDQPAEVLHALADKSGVPLLMPELGKPVEPAHVARTDPWWRRVETRAGPTPVVEPDLPPKNLPKALQWPLD